MEEIVSYIADQIFAGLLSESQNNKNPFLPEFFYNNIPFSHKTWKWDVEPGEDKGSFQKYVSTFVSPDKLLQLQLNYTVYSDYPVVECVPVLSAIGKSDTGIIDSFRSYVMEFPLEQGEYHKYISAEKLVTVRRTFGLEYRHDDLLPDNVVLRDRYPADRLSVSSCDGYSSTSFLPYLGVDFGIDYGINIGIGWASGWNCNFKITENTMRIDLGMKTTHFFMHPGESVRQPSFFIMLRDGISVAECQNLHRRFMLDFHTPHTSSGNIPFILPDLLEHKSKAVTKVDTEQNIENHNIDLNKQEDGNRAYEDELPSDNSPYVSLTLLRLFSEDPIAKEHRQWLLKERRNKDVFLLNLGIPEAVQFLLEKTVDLVKNHNTVWIRNPNCTNPAPYWDMADRADRQGYTEAAYITGLYKFWDSLREALPDVILENVDTGMSDFETATRCISLNYLSYRDSAPLRARKLPALLEWLPCAGTGGTQSAYIELTASAAGTKFSYLDKVLKSSTLQRMMKYIYCDMYKPDGSFPGYQFHDPEIQEGFVAVIRPPESDVKTQIINLEGLNKKAVYTLEDSAGKKRRLEGKELAKLTVDIARSGDVRHFFYSPVPDSGKKSK